MALLLVGANARWRQWVKKLGHAIHFPFGSMVGFSKSAYEMTLFPVGPNPRSQPSAVLYNFERPYLGNGSPIQFVFRCRLKVWDKIMRDE